MDMHSESRQKESGADMSTARVVDARTHRIPLWSRRKKETHCRPHLSGTSDGSDLRHAVREFVSLCADEIAVRTRRSFRFVCKHNGPPHPVAKAGCCIDSAKVEVRLLGAAFRNDGTTPKLSSTAKAMLRESANILLHQSLPFLRVLAATVPPT